MAMTQPFDYEATVDALAILQQAMYATASGPSAGFDLVAHAMRRLNRELNDYLRGVR